MNQEPRDLSNWDILARLLGFLRPFAGWTALSVLLGAATIASGIGLLGASAYVISGAALHPSIATLQVAIVGVRFFGITRGLFRYLERLVSHSVNFQLLAGLRVWFYRALEPLAPARLQSYRSGDLLGRAVGDIETLENFYVRAVASPLVAVIVTVGMGLFVGRYDLRLGAILAGGLLLSCVATPLLANRLGRTPGWALVAARAELSAALVDGAQGLGDLLSFGQGEARLSQIHSLNEDAGRAQVRLAWAGGLSNAFSLLVTNLTLLAVLVVAIPLVSGGSLSGVLLAVIAMLVLASFEAANPLPQAGQQLESSITAARRLFELVRAEPEIKSMPVPLAAPRSPALRIRGLTFRYAAELPPALEGLDLDLPPGKRVAIVGASGAGKTTLLNLLLRFWEFEQGVIELDGQDIRCYRPEDVRRLMGVISQSPYLFTTTIRQNLRLANPDASDANLERALRLAELQEWAAGLPEGLETWVGERGQNLSGGERERLALARVLAQDAPVALLDEPTAHLDALTEQRLLRSLETALRGRSLLMVTHRLSGLEAMDEILVLRSGRVVERGTHAALIAMNGEYAALWALQNRALEEGGGTNSGGLAS